MKVVPNISEIAKRATPINKDMGTPSIVEVPSSEEIKREVSHNMGHEWYLTVNGNRQAGVFYSIANCYRYLTANYAKFRNELVDDGFGRKSISVSISSRTNPKVIGFFLNANADGNDCAVRHKAFKLTDFNVDDWLQNERGIRNRLRREQRESIQTSKASVVSIEEKDEILTQVVKDTDVKPEDLDPIELGLTIDDSPNWIISGFALMFVVLLTILGIFKWLS